LGDKGDTVSAGCRFEFEQHHGSFQQVMLPEQAGMAGDTLQEIARENIGSSVRRTQQDESG
jgi:hypothetical protein